MGILITITILNNEKLKNIAIAQEKVLENVQTATFNLGDLPPINVNVKAPIVKDNSTYYSVIAGAFRSRRNAEKHLNTLIINGYQASYTSVNPKRPFQSSICKAENKRKEAADLISKIKTSGQDTGY